ncbi:hypothetical protein [Psychromicrobium lacuslunae]|uniref:Uncharacterized protein n=1 Tax=Psychromicrobium lacuslunae TaxID=1618207 RepID=A0A0D4C058_9MICC|nr:hypothetical protein [Psychromicrobium lacuslunae]AJT42042.1 hypothetical protein UM93_11925 [Psychromicrobium lacuslunae]
MKKVIYRSGVAGAVLVAASLALAPAATAAPVATVAKVSQPAPRATIGDGVWAPSHDEALAIIPLCQPLKLLSWLNANFTDHGKDIAKYLTENPAALAKALLSLNPAEALKLLLKDFLQIPVYAINDTTFHIPATLGDILSFCASARS